MLPHAILPMLIAASLTPGQATATQAERESLEDYLARLRVKETETLDALRPELDLRLSELSEAVESKRKIAIKAARTRLIDLGPNVAPLLISRIEPGADADGSAIALAQAVAETLIVLRSEAVTESLVHLAYKGSLEGRLNAVRVMGASPRSERVGPVLALIFDQVEGPLKSAALVAMAKVGGDTAQQKLSVALKSSDRELVRVALKALTDAESTGAAPGVLELIQSGKPAAKNMSGILAYYAACPDVVDEAHVDELLGWVEARTNPLEERRRALEALPRYAEKMLATHKKKLRKLAEGVDPALREGARVCLAVLGDRGAKRDLLEPYNRKIAKNGDWAKHYEDRAALHYRIGGWRDAVRDYREALRIGPANGRGSLEEAHVGLALSYTMQGKLKEAAQTLRRAPLSTRKLRELAKHPDFKKLRESSKYGDVFPGG